MTELSQDAISSYLVENKDAIMKALGFEEGGSAGDIGTALYDKLQGGDTISVPMSDGGTLSIKGHFDEGGEDTWHMEISYAVPANGTSKCFPAGSKMSVKGGTVTLIADPAEITDMQPYDMAVCVYGYQVDIAGVTIDDGNGNSFKLDITGLTKPTDWDNPCIIDPNGATYEITLHDFVMPPADASGTVKVDDKEVKWSEVSKLIK